MAQATQLQFRLMSAEAQCAAVQRLLLRGLSIDEIANQTSWSPAEVRRALKERVVQESIEPPRFAPWKVRRSRGGLEMQQT
jgi:hypothetical protein